MTQLLRTLTLAVMTSVAAGATAHAQTGVSDNRMSLPDGVGSLEGIGDDASVTGNMGAMSYRVDMPVPGGFEGVTPTLGLAYSSTSGPAEAGVGWSFDTPSIERLTLRGVPEYDVDDEFTGESRQLVYVGGTNPREYRSRFEGAFIRYRWYDAGDGAGGYWTAEYPDGRIGYFGADAGSDTVSAARVGGDDGVFRYQLVDVVDVYGHRMSYAWTDVGSTSLLTHVAWVFDGDTPRYTADLSWDDRDDVVINATGGFVEVLEHRLAEVEVFSNGTSIDRWALTYDDMVASGGISRLSRVERFGVGDVPFPVVPAWSYSAALGADCDGACARPVVYGMGTLGVNLASGDPQLIDINGDALPDIVDPTLVGSPHRIFENVLSSDGTQAFASARDSATGTQDGFDFSNGRVQVLDVNGDGFTDVVNMATGSVLTNEGLGDRVADATAGDVGTLPDFDNPANLVAMRFIDIDNDRRIDLVRASGSGDSHVTRVYRNTDAGFVELDDAESIGFGFDAGTMEVNDINGDGLVDVARVTASGVAYRLNIGHGRWWPADDWAMAEFTDAGIEASELETAELDDLNGDGLADLSLVRGTTVEVWINRAGASLVPIDPITESDVDAVDGAEIPARTGNTTVLVADMNANGSSDIVWVTESGEVTVMDLFPVRPNLLTRVDNGLGGVIDVTYGTSAAERARDADAGAAWAHPMPMPHLVVTGMVRSDDLGSVPVEMRYSYHDGFYDGVEKAFRGYARVVETRLGDETQAGSVTTSTWSTGVEDPYEAGAALGAAITSDTGDAMTTSTTTYADCPLEVDDSGLLFDIRYWCVVQQDVVEQDGVDASDWRTIRTTMAYDGWGQVTTETMHGVVAIGGADGGSECEGDEFETRTTYVEPLTGTDGRWILGRAARIAGYGGPDLDELAFETAYRYDGDAFEGLPEGELTLGGLTRELRWLDDRWLDAVRNRLDEHGHVTESLDALGEPGGDGHRVRTEWDALGLRPVATEFEVDATTTLRRDYTYESIRGQVEPISNWYRPGTADAQVFSTATNDGFGRLIEAELDGSNAFAETLTFSYDAIDNLLARTSSLGEASPAHDANRVLHAERPHGLASYAGGAVEYDGAGRVTRRGDLVTSWSGFGRLAEVETSTGLRITFEDSGEERVLEHDSDGGRAILFGADFALEDGIASILPQIGDVSTARIEYVDVATLAWADLAPVAIDGDAFTAAPDGAISAADAWVAYASDRDLLAGIETTENPEALLTASAAQGLHGFGDRTTWLHRGRGAHLVAVTDEDGALVERPIEYPFGLRRDATNGAPERTRMSDQSDHVEAELVSFPLRNYDPMMGRWLRPDEFFAPLTPMHLARPWEATGSYSYVQNDPINSYDPTGAVGTPGGTETSMDGESMYDPPDGPATPETPGGGAEGPSAAELRARLVGLADAGGVAMAAAGGRGPGADGNLDLADDDVQIDEIEPGGEGHVDEADIDFEPDNGGGGGDAFENMMNDLAQLSATPGGGPPAPAAQARPRPPRPVQPPMGGGGQVAPAAGPVLGLAALSARYVARGSIQDAVIQQSQSRIISMEHQVNIRANGRSISDRLSARAGYAVRRFAFGVGVLKTRPVR